MAHNTSNALCKAGALALCLLPSHAFSAENYQVKFGDTLSHIAKRFYAKPIYGPLGGLRNLIELNPQIKDPDKIYVGQLLQTSARKNQQGLVLKSKIAKILETEVSKVPLRNEKQVLVEKKDKLPSEIETQTEFSYGLMGAYKRIDAVTNDALKTKSTALSQLGYGATFKWTQIWHPKWNSSLGLEALSYLFRVSDNKSLLDDEILESKLNLDVNYKPLEWFTIGLAPSYSLKSAIVSTSDTNSLRLESIYLPALAINTNLRLLEIKRLNLRWKNSVENNFPFTSEKISTKNSLAYSTALLFDYSKEESSFASGLEYNLLNLEAKRANQDISRLSFLMQYSHSY